MCALFVELKAGRILTTLVDVKSSTMNAKSAEKTEHRGQFVGTANKERKHHHHRSLSYTDLHVHAMQGIMHARTHTHTHTDTHTHRHTHTYTHTHTHTHTQTQTFPTVPNFPARFKL